VHVLQKHFDAGFLKELSRNVLQALREELS
jgi:hypothetical protein